MLSVQWILVQKYHVVTADLFRCIFTEIFCYTAFHHMENLHETRGYLIGGLPRTGKTTLAARISRERDIEYVRTDTMRTMFRADPHSSVALGSDVKIAAKAFRPYLWALVAGTIRDNGIIVEGELVDPKMTSRLHDYGPVASCFFGLNDAQAAYHRLRAISDPTDWTARMDHDDLTHLLGKYVQRSKRLEEACGRLGLTYFDASEDVGRVQQQAYDHLLTTPPTRETAA